MKKFLCLISALVFCLALMPMTAPADAANLYIYGGAGGAGGATGTDETAIGGGGVGGYVGATSTVPSDTEADDADGGKGVTIIEGAVAGGGGGGCGAATTSHRTGGTGGNGAPNEDPNKGTPGNNGTDEPVASGKGGRGGIEGVGGEGGAKGTDHATAGGGGGGGGGAQMDGGFSSEPYGTLEVKGGDGGAKTSGEYDGDGGDGGSAFVNINNIPVSVTTALSVLGGAGHATGGSGGDATLWADELTVTGNVAVTGGSDADGGEAKLRIFDHLITGSGTVNVTGNNGFAHLYAEKFTTGTGAVTVASGTVGEATLDVPGDLTAKGNITLTQGTQDLWFDVGALVVDADSGTVNLTVTNSPNVILSDGLKLKSGTFSTSTYTAPVKLTVMGQSTLDSAVNLTGMKLIFEIPDDRNDISKSWPLEDDDFDDEQDALLTLGNTITLNVSNFAGIDIFPAEDATLEVGEVITLIKISNGTSLNMGGDSPITAPSTEPEPGEQLFEFTCDDGDYTYKYIVYYQEDKEDDENGYIVARVTDIQEIPSDNGGDDDDDDDDDDDKKSSSGCSAGMFGMLALLAMPLMIMKKKEK